MPFRILGEPWKTLGGPFGGILGSGPRGQLGVDFLFRDDFITAEVAPLTSSRTAEPGPGNIAFTDTGNKLSISAGELVAGIGTAANDPRWVDDNGATTRVAGIVAMFRHKRPATAFLAPTFGWNNDILPRLTTMNGVLIGGGNDIQAALPSTQISTGLVNVDDVYNNYFVILRGAGFFLVVDEALGWVSSIGAGNPFLGWSSVTVRLGGTLDTVRVSQLPSPWDTDFGIATDRLAGARTAGDTFVHEADCLIEFEVTVLTGGAIMAVRFRIQDALNYWIIRIESDGDFKLQEVAGGIENLRAVAAGVIGNGERIVIIAEDETIRGYHDNMLGWTYALAANFKTETSGELNSEGTGSISDIVSWPRVISSTARRALDRVANA